MLNKFMHPRNIYKNPPDFNKLASKFEEFSSIAKADITGKISIDFKDTNSLRILTKCLLKSDFNLEVQIPEDRLVPTLPLRLNYILWIEDLLDSIKRVDNIKGLDIGTGACAIYPLLAATKNKWQMVGTESDDQSLIYATENVKRNQLQELISLKRNTTKSILEFLLKDGSEKFDFSMCNPPFYSNMQELCESRSPARLPPKNGFTGSPQELITEGGELSFCRKMIEESKQYQDNVLIFTSMVGHKCNLRELAQDLQAEGVNHTTTEFCQGRVTRWGLAWSYQNYDLAELVPGRNTPRKKTKPVIFLLPKLPDVPYDVENVSKKVTSILHILKVNIKVLNKRGNSLTLDIKATEKTWSNQRRKRRIMKRIEEGNGKKPKIEENDRCKTEEVTIDGRSNSSIKEGNNNSKDLAESINGHTGRDVHCKTEEATNNDKSKTSATEDNNNSKNLAESKIENTDRDVHCKTATIDDKSNCSTKEGSDNSKDLVQSKIENTDRHVHEDSDITQAGWAQPNTFDPKAVKSNPVVVHAIMKLFKKDSDILLELEFLDGTSGKEGLHQVVQYIKNNWK